MTRIEGLAASRVSLNRTCSKVSHLLTVIEPTRTLTCVSASSETL